jgi:hypothetical protein
MPSKSASFVACLAATAAISPLPALAAGPWYGVPLPDKTGLDPDEVYAQRDFRDVSPSGAADPVGFADIDGDTLYGYVRDQVDISLRNRAEGDIVWGRVAGRSGDRLATAYVRRQFEALGLTDVGVETVELAPQYWPVDVELTLIASAAAGEETTDYRFETAMPQPGSPATARRGLTGDLIYVGYGREIDIAGRDLDGRIAVLRGRPAQGAYNTARDVPDRLAAAGATAVIVILDLPIDVQTYNRGLSGTAVPTIAIADYEGTFLENVMVGAGDEPVAARIRLRLEADDSSTSNVVGRVVGTSDEYAIIIAHRDAFFYGAVDNGSGVAAMLGIAAHLARQAEPPRRTHIFVATGAHHVSGFPGSTAFAEANLDIREKTAIVLNAEHVAAVQAIQYTAMDYAQWGSTGGLLVSDAEIPRYGSVVPRSQIVLDALSNSLARHGVTMLANAWDQAPGDVWPFQRRGFPVAQIIEVSNWYHTTADRLAVIPPAGLERATRALAGFLQEIDSHPLRELGQQAPAVGR